LTVRTQVDEERLASQTLVENLMNRFGTKPIVKENQVIILFSSSPFSGQSGWGGVMSPATLSRA
jgi:hypothetical protein